MVAIPEYLGEAPELPIAVECGARFQFRFYMYADEFGTVAVPLTDFDGASAEWVVAKWHGGIQVARIGTDGDDIQGEILIDEGEDDNALTTAFIEINVPGTITNAWPPGEWVHDFTVYAEDTPENGDRFFKGPCRIWDRVKV